MNMAPQYPSHSSATGAVVCKCSKDSGHNHDGRAEIDNNTAERSMSSAAIGKKIGSLPDPRLVENAWLPSIPSSRLASWVASRPKATSPMSWRRSLAAGPHPAGTTSYLGTGHLQTTPCKPHNWRVTGQAYPLPSRRGVESRLRAEQKQVCEFTPQPYKRADSLTGGRQSSTQRIRRLFVLQQRHGGRPFESWIIKAKTHGKAPPKPKPTNQNRTFNNRCVCDRSRKTL